MISIAGVEIGPGNPCRIVAEISNNHNGRLDLAYRLIHECAEAGADFIKFQAYTPDELVALRGDGPAPEPWGSEGWSMRDLYEKAQTPLSWFPGLIEQCERDGVPWFASVFGFESYMTMEGFGCPAYKVAALDAGTSFARAFTWCKKPVIASSRGERIDTADMTLYCPPGYPQAGSDINPSGGCDGFSYHGTEWSELIWATGALSMIECHVHLDDEPSELEANVSITVSDLKLLCDVARAVHA